MAGLGLDPIEVTRWLAGTSQHDFGVANDRMPPVSYWAQWCWSRVFGLTERSLRSFRIVCVSLATLVVFSTGRPRLGDACRLRGGADAGHLAQCGIPRAGDPGLSALHPGSGSDVLDHGATPRRAISRGFRHGPACGSRGHGYPVCVYPLLRPGSFRQRFPGPADSEPGSAGTTSGAGRGDGRARHRAGSG